jgi:hypothetical protein
MFNYTKNFWPPRLQELQEKQQAFLASLGGLGALVAD